MRHTRQGRRRGGNAVEFALVTPVLVMMLMGIVEYGWYFSQHQSVVTAARHAARFGAAMPWEDDPEEWAVQEVLDSMERQGIAVHDAAVEAHFEGETPYVTLVLNVDVSYPGLTGLVPTPQTISTEVMMRLEDQPLP